MNSEWRFLLLFLRQFTWLKNGLDRIMNPAQVELETKLGLQSVGQGICTSDDGHDQRKYQTAQIGVAG